MTPDKTPQLDLREYIHDMPVCLAAADLVISRAGAMTLSEIQATGKASILIPSPNVAENHQYHNAMALVNPGRRRNCGRKRPDGRRLVGKGTEDFRPARRRRPVG